MINGFDSLVITKLDVLDQMDEIPVCTRYKNTPEMPATYRALEAVEPEYLMLPGWKANTRGLSRYQDLPPKACDYMKFLSDHTASRSAAYPPAPNARKPS